MGQLSMKFAWNEDAVTPYFQSARPKQSDVTSIACNNTEKIVFHNVIHKITDGILLSSLRLLRNRNN
jgi:hypothetical protein